MRNKIENTLEKIFKQIFKKKGNLKNLKRINEEKWDSLAHVNLIVAIESEFKIRLKPHQIENMNSFKSIVILLNKKK
tara:strand:+ start:324 stop:554 length:231 start_codon:yes stop_codon:yes gene_type:complete